jgi:hypothetical protein
MPLSEHLTPPETTPVPTGSMDPGAGNWTQVWPIASHFTGLLRYIVVATYKHILYVRLTSFVTRGQSCVVMLLQHVLLHLKICVGALFHAVNSWLQQTTEQSHLTHSQGDDSSKLRVRRWERGLYKELIFALLFSLIHFGPSVCLLHSAGTKCI